MKFLAPGMVIKPGMKGIIPSDSYRYSGMGFEIIGPDESDFRGCRWFAKIDGEESPQLLCFNAQMSEDEFRHYFLV